MGVSILCVLVAGIVAELYLGRVVGMSYYPEARRYFRMLVRDPVLGYRHAANLSEEFQGVQVVTNRRDLRAFQDVLLERFEIHSP
jgi:hypothetical protein